MLKYIYEKSVGVCTCYPSHCLRPSRCPSLSNEQRRSPRRYVNLLCATIVGNAVTEYYTPMDIYRCLIPDRDWSLRSFKQSRTKRQVNALSYMYPHPLDFCYHRKSIWWECCKFSFLFWKCKRKRIKSSVIFCNTVITGNKFLHSEISTAPKVHRKFTERNKKGVTLL